MFNSLFKAIAQHKVGFGVGALALLLVLNGLMHYPPNPTMDLTGSVSGANRAKSQNMEPSRRTASKEEQALFKSNPSTEDLSVIGNVVATSGLTFNLIGNLKTKLNNGPQKLLLFSATADKEAVQLNKLTFQFNTSKNVNATVVQMIELTTDKVVWTGTPTDYGFQMDLENEMIPANSSKTYLLNANISGAGEGSLVRTTLVASEATMNSGEATQGAQAQPIFHMVSF